jgi:16S rRNA C1402 (ribose-2'-O) methylase RsmI
LTTDNVTVLKERIIARKNRKTMIAPELKKLDETNLQQTRRRSIEDSADTSRPRCPVVILIPNP